MLPNLASEFGGEFSETGERLEIDLLLQNRAILLSTNVFHSAEHVGFLSPLLDGQRIRWFEGVLCQSIRKCIKFSTSQQSAHLSAS
jgi:hypothetical protein